MIRLFTDQFTGKKGKHKKELYVKYWSNKFLESPGRYLSAGISTHMLRWCGEILSKGPVKLELVLLFAYGESFEH